MPLGSRALEILIALLERAGELVSKEELMNRFGLTFSSSLPTSQFIFRHCAACFVTAAMATGSSSIFQGEATGSLPR